MSWVEPGGRSPRVILVSCAVSAWPLRRRPGSGACREWPVAGTCVPALRPSPVSPGRPHAGVRSSGIAPGDHLAGSRPLYGRRIPVGRIRIVSCSCIARFLLSVGCGGWGRPFRADPIRVSRGDLSPSGRWCSRGTSSASPPCTPGPSGSPIPGSPGPLRP